MTDKQHCGFIAIVGRPNVGKSTMVNFLLDEDRMLTGPEAGITRDAIAVPWTWDNREVSLIVECSYL